MTTKKKPAPKATTAAKKAAAQPKATSKQTVSEPAAVVRASAQKPSATRSAGGVATQAAPAAVETLTVTMAPEAPITAAATPTGPVAAPAPAAPTLTIGMFQKRLYERGFYNGHWDGQYGPLTRHAVAHFQAAKGLPVNGDATPETIAALGF